MQEWSLPTRHLGRRVLVHNSLNSTSDAALALAHDPALDGLAVLARHQSAGRGQYGRSWVAPPESSVLLSLLLFPPPCLRRPALLTAWAAVSVGELILSLTAEQARIKWPNDVFLKGKKVCGILIEQRSLGDRLATVVGIGLNVRQPASFFEETQLPLGGSLLSQTGKMVDWETAARLMLAHLDEEYDRLLQDGPQPLEALWKWRLGLLGRQVRVETAQGLQSGRLLEVSFDGLLLQTGESYLRLQPEAVRHLEPA